MKHPIRAVLQKVDYAIRPFCHWLAPVCAAALAVLISHFAVSVNLPEALADYEIFFLIFGFLFSGFFLLITAPCVAYSSFLSVQTMCKQRHFVLPAIQLLLNAALLAAWIMTLLKLIG